MIKYSVIVEYTTGERTGATVTAFGQAGAWQKVLEMFDSRNLRSVQIAEILLPEREG